MKLDAYSHCIFVLRLLYFGSKYVKLNRISVYYNERIEYHDKLEGNSQSKNSFASPLNEYHVDVNVICSARKGIIIIIQQVGDKWYTQTLKTPNTILGMNEIWNCSLPVITLGI